MQAVFLHVPDELGQEAIRLRERLTNDSRVVS
jgi:hypothetical protein